MLFAMHQLFLFCTQEPVIESKYDPHNLFSPDALFIRPVNISRASTGEPNIGYWQNKADYQINVSLG